MRATTATHIQTRRQRKAARKNSHLCNSNENQRQTSRKTAATKSPDHYQLVAVLMDVTARKQLRDQLSHSQKMEAFGQLAGGVAHDFNNFLTAILGYSDLLVAEIPGRGTGAKYLSEIRSAAGRAASLTRQLLTFSRRQPLEPRVLEVNTLIHNLERSILRLLGENISVLCELMAEKRHIKVDPD